LDVKDLRYFIAVYETRGFLRASESLGTVQSNVSTRIKSLEDRLGARLFDRGYRSVLPTVTADRLYGRAKELISMLEKTVGEVRLAEIVPSGRPHTVGIAGDDGFTLLELLVVIVIIGLLAGFVAPQYFSHVGKSEIQVARAQIDAFEKALDQYRLDTRHYPTSEQGLLALVERPANEPFWNGPYLRKRVPTDPWGRTYLYRSPGMNGEYEIISYGKDGQPGGSGEAGDIANF
jgi:general secretion pathway protein G